MVAGVRRFRQRIATIHLISHLEYKLIGGTTFVALFYSALLSFPIALHVQIIRISSILCFHCPRQLRVICLDIHVQRSIIDMQEARV